MKKTCLLVAIAMMGMLALAGCSGDGSNMTNRSPRNETANSTASPTPAANMANANMNKSAMGDDMDFMTEADMGGMAEVEMGKLAQTKAQDPEVKKFAAMMVTDHTKAGSELKELGKKKDFKPATELDSKHKALMEKLKGLSGADFDKAYVDEMVDDHETDVDLFKSQAESGKDPDIKAFAAKTLPVLQKHLDAINQIKSKMK